VLLLTFVASHVPLIVLLVYVVMASGLDFDEGRAVLLVGLAATIVGTGIVWAGIWALLTPISAASEALAAYRQRGERVALPDTLTDESGILLANVQHTLTQLDDTIAQLQDLASRDALTGMYNRREGERRLTADLDAFRDTGRPFDLLVLDADGLKRINDKWGHAMGDYALQHLAAMIEEHVGQSGWVARWGGDEFVAVVQAEDGTRSAEAVVEAINTTLGQQPIRLPEDGVVQVSLSIGYERARRSDDAASLFARADAAQYRTKVLHAPGRSRGSSGSSVDLHNPMR
jgi:diguanylate cyclase (GGDEF)-like protein